MEGDDVEGGAEVAEVGAPSDGVPVGCVTSSFDDVEGAGAPSVASVACVAMPRDNAVMIVCVTVCDAIGFDPGFRLPMR